MMAFLQWAIANYNRHHSHYGGPKQLAGRRPRGHSLSQLWLHRLQRHGIASHHMHARARVPPRQLNILLEARNDNLWHGVAVYMLCTRCFMSMQLAVQLPIALIRLQADNWLAP